MISFSKSIFPYSILVTFIIPVEAHGNKSLGINTGFLVTYVGSLLRHMATNPLASSETPSNNSSGKSSSAVVMLRRVSCTSRSLNESKLNQYVNIKITSFCAAVFSLNRTRTNIGNSNPSYFSILAKGRLLEVNKIQL